MEARRQTHRPAPNKVLDVDVRIILLKKVGSMTVMQVDRVAAALERAKVDALILVSGVNLHYTLGIKQMLRERPNIYTIFPDGTIAASLPGLEVPNFLSMIPAAEVVSWSDAEGPADAALRLGAIIRERAHSNSPRVAVEYYTMQILERDLLLPGLGQPELLPAEEIIDELRMVKTPEEVEAMRRACRIAEESLERTLARFAPGMTEKQIADELKIEMLRLGSEELPKEPTVSSGPRTAFPHTKTTDRPVTRGEPLMIDTGARFQGYCSDITRTFFVGSPPAEYVKIYDLEYATSRHVLERIRAGVTLDGLDEAAHRFVEATGYGQYFPHRVGHGLGMDGHEAPSVVMGNRQVAAAGLTFTVEPGIYVAGMGGARIEENVAVTPDGVDVLTAFPRELRCL